MESGNYLLIINLGFIVRSFSLLKLLNFSCTHDSIPNVYKNEKNLYPSYIRSSTHLRHVPWSPRSPGSSYTESFHLYRISWSPKDQPPISHERGINSKLQSMLNATSLISKKITKTLSPPQACLKVQSLTSLRKNELASQLSFLLIFLHLFHYCLSNSWSIGQSVFDMDDDDSKTF